MTTKRQRDWSAVPEAVRLWTYLHGFEPLRGDRSYPLCECELEWLQVSYSDPAAHIYFARGPAFPLRSLAKGTHVFVLPGGYAVVQIPMTVAEARAAARYARVSVLEVL